MESFLFPSPVGKLWLPKNLEEVEDRAKKSAIRVKSVWNLFSTAVDGVMVAPKEREQT